MTKVEAIRQEVNEALVAYLVEERIETARVEVIREPVRDLEREAEVDDEAYRWKRGKALVIKLTVELKPGE